MLLHTYVLTINVYVCKYLHYMAIWKLEKSLPTTDTNTFRITPTSTKIFLWKKNVNYRFTSIPTWWHKHFLGYYYPPSIYKYSVLVCFQKKVRLIRCSKLLKSNKEKFERTFVNTFCLLAKKAYSTWRL